MTHHPAPAPPHRAMNRLCHCLLTLAVSTLVVALQVAVVQAETTPEFPAQDIEFFEQQVRPILANRCWSCHGEKKQESGLRLDSRAGVLAGGDGSPQIVVPGQPDGSTLITAVKRTGDYEMPPDEPLPPAEIEALVAWVKLGLPWPAENSAPAMLTMPDRLARDRQEHWAFRPIRRLEMPTVSQPDWIRQPLDVFILARLEAAGLSPSAPAGRRTLIRRATFDLLGLPPTPEEVAAFVNDSRPAAYERLIDRLLASPRYGERWGRHWLDVARYSDTRGYAFARERRFPYAYTYRDYVIGAFNEDLPFDRFVLEQLAADRLGLAGDDAALAGMGFLTVGRRFNNRHDDLDDQIDVVSRGLLGLTVACARCHDHKYDAIPTEDYYSLYGVFASSHEPDELPLLADPESTPGYDEFKQQLDNLRGELNDFERAQHQQIVETARERVTEYVVRATTKQPEELLQKLPFISLSPDELRPRIVERWRTYLLQTAQPDHPVFGPWRDFASLSDDQFAAQASGVVKKWKEVSDERLNPLVEAALFASTPESKIDVARIYGKLFEDAYAAWKSAGGDGDALAKLPAAQQPLAQILLDDDSPTDIPLDDLRNYLNRDERNKHTELEKKLDSHQVQSPGAPARAMVLLDNAAAHNPRVFIRGNHARPGDAVPRRFVAVLSGDSRQPFSDGSGRLELAREIAAADNPLTARVIVNRLWMHHFGQPLVSTPSDFGIRSDAPTHPQLLDYLARALIDGGWSLKAIHREIMLSATYQQSSVIPSSNQQSQISNQQSVDPENRLLWRMNRRRLEFEPLRDSLLAVAGQLDTSLGGKPVDLLASPYGRRRAVYGTIDRQDLPNLLRVFDFASPDQSAADRPRTTVPQQALFMMNSPFVVEQAKALAARTEIAASNDSLQQLDRLYHILFARSPTPEEIQVAQEFIATSSESNASKLSPLEQFAQLLLLTNEFTYID